MKKTLLILVIISTLTSCKKEHKCTCSYTSNGYTFKETIVYHKASEKTAKRDCTTQPLTIQDDLNYSSVTVSQTCVLD